VTPNRPLSWGRFWTGLALVVGGQIVWILSFGQAPELGFSLLAASIALNVAGLVILVPVLVKGIKLRWGVGPSPAAAAEGEEPNVTTRTLVSATELDTLWRGGPRIGAITLIVTGPIVAGLAVWWIQISFFSHRGGGSGAGAVGVAAVLLGLACFALGSGLWFYRRKPSELEVNELGLWVKHVHAPPLAFKWTDRPLRMSIADHRADALGIQGSPPCMVTVGRWLQYGVPTRVVDAILLQLNAHGIQIDSEAMGSGWAKWTYYTVKVP